MHHIFCWVHQAFDYCRGSRVADVSHTSETVTRSSPSVTLPHYPSTCLYGFSLLDHYLYFSSNGTPFLKDDWGLTNRNYFTVEQILSSSTAEDHGVSGDPFFVDVAQKDFHLQAASPAITQADSNEAPLTDKDGSNRDSQTDIGAYEYQKVSTDNIPPLARKNCTRLLCDGNF